MYKQIKLTGNWEMKDSFEVLAEFLAECATVAYYPEYTTITSSPAAGVMLSQMCDHSVESASNGGDGWFYKTREAWRRDTGINRSGQETARRILVEKGIIDERRKGIPAKMHFRVNFDRLFCLLSALD